MNNKEVRTRFCPSPTGAGLHIGGVKTAIINYLFAKANNGKFILRIEDTDSGRFVPGAEKNIIDSLKWIGITPDDGINDDGTAKYRQSEKDYSAHIKKLVDSGHAYYCFDTSEELDVMRAKVGEKSKKPFSYNSFYRTFMKNSFTLSPDEVKDRISKGEKYVLRLSTPVNKEIKLNDLIRGEVVFNTKNIDDKILLKSDGGPSYFLANTVDDIDMDITHVIKGSEWLSSYPTIALLYEAFGCEIPKFAHVPLLNGPDGKKLSKRKVKEYGFPVCLLEGVEKDENGVETKFSGFKEEGYIPEAFLNFLTLIGWNNKDNKELYSLEELIGVFSLDNIAKADAQFDLKKAKYYNATYLRNKSSDDLLKFIDTKGNNSYSYVDLQKIVEVAKERAEFSKDLSYAVSYFFVAPIVSVNDVPLKNPEEFTKVMNLFLSKLSLMDWNTDEIHKVIHDLCDFVGIKSGKVMPDLRRAICGTLPGPEMPVIMSIMSKDDVRSRIEMLLVPNLA
jgi:glutamyl-tRNA synthetase